MTDSPNEEPSQLALGINNIRKYQKIRVDIIISEEMEIFEFIFQENVVLLNHVLN